MSRLEQVRDPDVIRRVLRMRSSRTLGPAADGFIHPSCLPPGCTDWDQDVQDEMDIADATFEVEASR